MTSDCVFDSYVVRIAGIFCIILTENSAAGSYKVHVQPTGGDLVHYCTGAEKGQVRVPRI